MPTYEVKIVGQLVRSFIIDEAEDEVDARNLAESEFLDNYTVVVSDGSGIAWDIIETASSSEVL
jgi:hypothetical protein